MTLFKKSEFNLNEKETASVIDELPLWSAPFGLKLLDAIKFKPNISVLDIGFGLGFPIIEIAQRLGSSSRIYGIDPWKTAIERAQTKINILGIKNIKLIEGVAENIPLPDDSIDLIVSNNGINNVQSLDKVLGECKRITKTSAQFLATMNTEETMSEFYSELENVLTDEGLNENVIALKKHIQEKRRPLDEVKNLFEKNMFRVEKINTDSFKYRYLNATAMFNHSFIRMAFMDSWLDIVPLDKIEFIFGEVENSLNKKANELGEMVLTIPFALINATKI